MPVKGIPRRPVDAGESVCMMCIANGECDNVARPAKGANGDCYWYGLNLALRRMVSARRCHNRHDAPYRQRNRALNKGQMGFDGSVVGSE